MLLAFDIDGTLVTDDKEITDLTLKTLKTLKDQGHILAPCTGRNYNDLPDILANSGLFDYVVGANGTLVYDRVNKQTIHSDYFNADEFIEIIEMLEPYEASYDIVSDGVSYISIDVLNSLEEHNVPRVSCKFIRQSRKAVNDIKEDITKNQRKINRANVLFKDLDNRIKLLNDKDKFDFNIATSVPFNVELMPKGTSKLTGLDKLKEHLNLSNDDVIFFGDNYNDFEVLNSDYITVLMINGIKELRSIAKYTTEYDNNHDGVARFLIDYFKL